MESAADLTCVELTAAYAAREASSVETVHACLQRIADVDSSIQAVITVCADAALEQAALSDERWRTGTARRLEGVPFGVKDIIQTAGIRTTGGSRMYEEYIPEYTATAVERLTDAGAVLLAKVHSWEFAAHGVPFALTRNPWDVAHMAGGSSAGSAAAVSAREMPLAIGTDTGGSIRAPTAFCGITSMKPTFGRISRFGVMPISWTLDHVGPMARSVDDIALALEAMAGHDPRDPSSAKAPLGNYCAELNDSIAGMRIGWPENWFFEFCDPQVRLATEEAAGVLAGMGASIKPMRIPVLDEIDPVWLAWQIVLPECASLHEINSSHFDRYAPEFVTTMLEGRMALAIDYVRALRMRALIQEGFEEAFKTIDVLMTPGALAAAPRIEREDSTVEGWAVIGDERYPWTVSMRSTSVFNLAGLPALTLPSGFSDEGLPIAVQLVALPYREAMCLKVAKAYQSATDHHLQRPPVLVDEELTSTAD